MEDASSFALAALGCLVVIYVSSTVLLDRSPKQFWPSVPFSLPLIGNYHQIGSFRNLGNKLEEWARVYGKEKGVYEIKLFTDRVVVVCGEDNVVSVLSKRPLQVIRAPKIKAGIDSIGAMGLFTAEGETWKQEHGLIAAQLNKRNVEDYTQKIKQLCVILMHRWEKLSMDGSSVNITSDIYGFLADVQTLTVYGETFGFLEKGYTGGDIERLLGGGSNRSLSPFPYWNIPVIGQYLDGIGTVKDRYQKFMNTLLDKYEKALEDPTSARNCSQKNTFLDKIYGQMKSEKSPISRERTIGNLLTLLLGGTDTTGASLLFAVYWLAKDNTGWREAVTKEADAFDLESATLDDVKKHLPRMKSFLHELHRHYGGSPFMMFQVAKDIPMCDTVISKGTCVFTLLRYPSTNPTSPASDVPFGPNQEHPSEFCPQRYLGADEDGRLYAKSPDTKKGAFLPFGYGLRSCPGRMFAETIQFFTLVSLLKTFEMSLEPNHPKVGKKFRFIDVPTHDIKLKLKKRV
jgi:cytochrome P450